MRGFSIKTLGCKVNRVESDSFQADLIEHGWDLVDQAEADLIIINTCTVTSEAESKVRKAIRHAFTVAPQATVIATGCAATMGKAELLSTFGEDRLILELDKDRVVKRCLDLFGSGAKRDARSIRGAGAFRSRGTIKIQDGCDNFCTYCIVAHARGPLVSTPVARILEEAESLRCVGIRELVLTGINLGKYKHTDEAGATWDLAALIRRLSCVGIGRIRLSSIEPVDLTDDLLAALKESECALHLHVPLQSGSDEILRQMGRGYTTEEYLDVISAARTALPGLTVTTDVIVGFPGETDEQFEETYRFCSRLGFSKIHVFRYSAREHTLAASRSDQIGPGTIKARAKRLRALSDTLRDEFILSRIERIRAEPLSIMVETVEKEGEGAWRVGGTSSEYLKVSYLTKDAPEVGSMIAVVDGQALTLR